MNSSSERSSSSSTTGSELFPFLALLAFASTVSAVAVDASDDSVITCGQTFGTGLGAPSPTSHVSKATTRLDLRRCLCSELCFLFLGFSQSDEPPL
ncbi:hypothetical protein KC19_VG044100 [Ceratodon purpureus]|uniref:Secreted protein n=1 Tax=Ceratodon purpureus TaxID=3225 RepID=A0A8T0HLY8_CERPU|nr:hypothetical protein KC19_VG044100 [Ceratodon purpureus]